MDGEKTSEPPGAAPGELETMPCPVCREDIRAGAQKCVKCSSDLRGWRRYISLGNTNLALLTALVSVVATAYPGLHRALMPGHAFVSVFPFAVLWRNYDSLDADITIGIANEGKSAGLISFNSYVVKLKRMSDEKEFDFYFRFHHADYLLRPNSTRTVKLNTKSVEISPPASVSRADLAALLDEALSTSLHPKVEIDCELDAEVRGGNGYVDFYPNYGDTILRRRTDNPPLFCSDLTFLAKEKFEGHAQT